MQKTTNIKRLSFVEFDRIHGKSVASAILGLLIVTLLISGCTLVGPDYVKPTGKMAGKQRS